jgi:hypothetical protein
MVCFHHPRAAFYANGGSDAWFFWLDENVCAYFVLQPSIMAAQ